MAAFFVGVGAPKWNDWPTFEEKLLRPSSSKWATWNSKIVLGDGTPSNCRKKMYQWSWRTCPNVEDTVYQSATQWHPWPYLSRISGNMIHGGWRHGFRALVVLRRRWVQSRNHYHEEPLEQCRSVGLTSVSPEKTIVVFIFSGETFSYCPKKSHKISRQNKKNQKHNDFNIKKWRSLWLVLISILKTVDWRLLFTVTELVSWNKPTTTTCHSVTRWRVCVYYISRLYLFIYIYISLYPLWLVVWWPYLCCLSHACTHPFSCQKFFDWFQKTKSINLIIHKSYNMCVYTHPYIHPCATIHIYTTLHITTTAYTFVYDMTTTISSWQQPTYHHHNNK